MLRYKEIKSMLIKDISQLNSLGRLPSRLALCKKYDTSRTTIDKAIKELEAEGVVFCKDGSGTYVTMPEGYDITKPSNWGIIVPNVCEDIYAGLVRGVEDIAQQCNTNMILCNFDYDPAKQELYIHRLILTGVSGIIIVPVILKNTMETHKLYSILTDAKKPVVFCNMEVPGINAPVVMSNGFYGGYIATKHLIKKGYRKIAYIMKYRYRTSDERCQGYMAALLEHGFDIDRDLIIVDESNSDMPEGYCAMQTLLAKKSVDAVFCFNDIVARGIYKAIQETELRISDDIGIIGYDNSECCMRLSPKMTSISYRSFEIGKMAAELLQKQIEGYSITSFPYYLFQPEIVERESCMGPKR